MFILNPKHKRHRKSGRHRRHHRRTKVCYLRKKVIRYKGQRLGWMTLVKRKGVKAAHKIWRSAKKMLAGR